ncbi:hypothetical protein CISIN_1g011642mg [Citrus sinensis]|uniref:G-patch domain-containing protein n=1 Tax=Citrus sinensis TaxID=2711 RepID=A0A067G1D6_CITSI|nr:hypothetical protein CISIN_1g011642mg [Citrus sinensis]
MAGTNEPDDSKETKSSDLFVWDKTSQLFFHASSGFYHDPNAGWYYSSRDGLYYKFENGNYVLLESYKVDECDRSSREGTATENPVQDEQRKQICGDCEDYSSIQLHESEDYTCVRSGQDEYSQGHMEHSINQTPENPPPPSAWLEETLIDLYLSGYNQVATADDGAMTTLGTDEGEKFKVSADGDSELEEGEWIPEDGFIHSSEEVSEEGVCWEEENWRSQYGQVTQPEEEPEMGLPVVELWEWSRVRQCRKRGKDQVARLVGYLVRRSVKLHPSMPSGGGLLRTAPICEVRRDLVRVTTGQVYRLRTPSAKYLASLSCYDSCNPTKDWGFPEISPLSEPTKKIESKSSDEVIECKGTPNLPDQLAAFGKHRSCAYRDRAAERRTLHGGIGVGPGQKRAAIGDDGRELSPDSTRTEDAAAEALKMSFGTGSYARNILESMGWKEGETLGNSTKGLVEPLEAIGNIGNAGLGWPQGRTKHH